MTSDASVRCPQCGAAGAADCGRIPLGHVFAGHDLDPPWDGGRLYRCRACGLGFRHPLRPMAEYQRLYETASDAVWVANDDRCDQPLVRARIQALCKAGDVLDVGCYDGALLAPLGPQYERYGIEPSRAAARRAGERGVQIVGHAIADLASIEQRFHVITAVDVIEHVPDPRAFLAALARLLAPGGALVISSGDMDAWAWRLAGGGYWYCAIPEHIAFVSTSWAHRVAAGLGLRVLGAQRFRYSDDAKGDRARGRRDLVKGALLTRLKDALEPLLPAALASRRRRYVLGHPTLFADHAVITFGRVEAA